MVSVDLLKQFPFFKGFDEGGLKKQAAMGADAQTDR